MIAALSFPSLRRVENPRDYTGIVVIHTFFFLSVMFYPQKVGPNDERQNSQRAVVPFVALQN